MSKKYKNHLQKYAAIGFATMLFASTLNVPTYIYAEGEDIESTADPQPESVGQETEQNSETTDDPIQATPLIGEQTEENDNVSLAQALKGEETTISNDSVFQIRIGYEFDDGSFDEWARGTGFLIGDKYLFTSQTLADTSSNSALYSKIVKAKKDMYEKVGILLTDAATTEAHTKIYITDINGNTFDYKNTITKSGMGVIILAKASPAPICIFSSEGKLSFVADDTVNLKFAGKDDSKASIQTTAGTVYEPDDESTTAGLYLKADTTNGNALGAPAYDGNGNIIGMVSAISNQDDSLTVLDQSAIQTFLASNNIDFKTLAQVQEEQHAAEEEQARKDAEEAQNAVADTKSLEEAIKNVEDINRNDYTEESLADLDNAMEEGQKILESRAKTQTQVDTAAKNINDALDQLVHKNLLQKIFGNFSNIIIYVGAGFVALIIIVLSVFALMKKGKKVKVNKQVMPSSNDEEEKYGYSQELSLAEKEEEKIRAEKNAKNIRKAKEEKAIEERATEESEKQNLKEKSIVPTKRDIYSDFDDEDFDDLDQDIDVTTRVKSKADRISSNKTQNGFTYAEDTGDGDVSILDEDGAEDTTVLDNRMPKGYLIRMDNGKRIDITKDKFLIGKERKKVDYCISGNSSVSRIHAMLRIIQGGFYIEDQDSTNYTFVNNNQIPAYKAVYLQDGAIIRISDVEFEFHEK